MVRHEADRAEDHGTRVAGRGPRLQMVTDVGIEPRDRGRARPRLPHHGGLRGGPRPGNGVSTEGARLEDQPRAVADLPRVELTTDPGRTCLGIRTERYGVGGEDELGAVAVSRSGKGGPCGIHRVGELGDEAWMVVELAQTRHPGRDTPPLGDSSSGPCDVLVVLPAPGVPAPGGRREHSGVADPVPGHGLGGVLDERVPVPVAEVHRDVQSPAFECAADGGDHLAVQVVQRATPAQGEVVFADHLEPFPGDTATPGDVLEEGDDVLRFLRPAEGQEQQRIKGQLCVGAQSAQEHHAFMVDIRPFMDAA